MENKHFQDWVTLIAGAWLVAAPFVLTISPPDGVSIWPLTINFVLSGTAAILLAVAALVYFRQWEEWLDMALGLWLIASPWVLGFVYAEVAVWTAVGTGILIAGMGAWTAYAVNRTGTA